MKEIKINNKTYYELICEKCNINFYRRKDEFKKKKDKCNGRILCYYCMKARKYEDNNFKICSKCKEKKPLNDFYKKNKNKRRYCSQCKKCMNEKNKEWIKKNREKNRQRCKEYREKNKEICKKSSENWRKMNHGKVLEEKRNNYHKNKKNINYKIKIQIRHLITKAFERKGYKKNSKTEKILGCEYEFFIKYLFETYKSNYGYEWDGIEKVHIDHIIPLSTAQTEEEIIKLNHYTNLQLLKAEDNLHKSNKLDWKLGDNNVK